MDGGTIPTHLTLYLMLGICIVLLTVDFIELFKIAKIWHSRFQFEPIFFEDCVKIDLIVKTIFTVFSLLAAFSALIFLSQLILFMQTFIKKFLSAFLYLNYLVFGLYMLAFCIFGFVKWGDIAYMCDKKDPTHKTLAIGNIFSLIGCAILAIIIVFGASIYSTMALYTDSLLRRENGSSMLRNAFWWCVFRGRGNDDLDIIHHPNNNNNDDEVIIVPPDQVENNIIEQPQPDDDNEALPLIADVGIENN